MATAARIADDIRNALAARAAAGGTGSVTVSIDGMATTYDERQALEALAFWESRAARASGRRRTISTMDLRRTF